MKTGLVLEGGGMRGIYTAGVLDVFLENDISFDAVVGVSAGAIYGADYMSGQKGRSLRYYKKYIKDRRLMGVWSWLTTGDFVNADFCYHRIPNQLDKADYETFRKNPAEFYVVCVNLDTNKAEYLRVTDLEKQMDYIRASASLPFLSRPVELEGKKYLDGGVVDSIPVKIFQEMGFDKIVVVQTQVSEYRKKASRHTGLRWMYKKYPELLKAMDVRHDRYNRTKEYIVEQEQEGRLFAIRPTVNLGLARLERNLDKIQAQYELGRADALAILEPLKAYIAE